MAHVRTQLAHLRNYGGETVVHGAGRLLGNYSQSYRAMPMASTRFRVGKWETSRNSIESTRPSSVDPDDSTEVDWLPASARARIRDEIARAYACTKEESIDDGYETSLSRYLLSSLRQYESLIFPIVDGWIEEVGLSEHVLGHVLFTISRASHVMPTERIEYLKRFQKHASPIVRDSVAAGLAEIGTDEAKHVLIHMGRVEEYPPLKRNLDKMVSAMSSETRAA